MKKLIKLVAYKHELDIKRGQSKYMDTDWIAQSIVDEIDEVKAEIMANNAPHLEDELSDILWGWLTLVENLKRRGCVKSHGSILKRALKKYEERILPLHGDNRDDNIWNEVKAKQKKVLEKKRDELK
jgi:hypothetical protein